MTKQSILRVNLDEEEKERLNNAIEVVKEHLVNFKNEKCNGMYDFYKSLESALFTLSTIDSGYIANEDFR